MAPNTTPSAPAVPAEPGQDGVPGVPGKPDGEARAPTAAPAGPAIPSTRAGTTWMVLAFGLVFLVVVLVFILENLRSVKASFFGAHWTIPLAVDLLLAAALGGLAVFLLGAVRIAQLRRLARRRHRAER